MAILAPLFAFVGRFVGKVLQTVFGWATILLFGRIPESKQLLLSGVALGAILWIATVLGVLAQRLVRTLCLQCKEKRDLEESSWETLVAPWKAAVPKGTTGQEPNGGKLKC